LASSQVELAYLLLRAGRRLADEDIAGAIDSVIARRIDVAGRIDHHVMGGP
jgi:hypothetical protein